MFEKFHEHIVQVPVLEGARPMTRADLWKGFECFARNATEFIEPLESMKVLDETIQPDGSVKVERELDFAQFKVKDIVMLYPERGEMKIEVVPSYQWPGSTMTARIEEPEAGHLFVRFIYEEPKLEGEAAHPTYVGLRRQAYEQKDQNLVGKIIEMSLAPVH